MLYRDHLRLSMQIGMVFILIFVVQLFIYVGLSDATIPEPDSGIVKILIFAGLWLWPLFITTTYVAFFPMAGKFVDLFRSPSLAKSLNLSMLLCVIAGASVFSFLETNKKIGLGLNQESVLLARFDRCLSKMAKSECANVDFKKCILRESNYKETFEYPHKLYDQPKLLEKLRTAYRKYCPRGIWLP